MTQTQLIESLERQLQDARRTGDRVDAEDLQARLHEVRTCRPEDFCEVCGDTRGLVDDVPGMWPHCPGCMTV